MGQFFGRKTEKAAATLWREKMPALRADSGWRVDGVVEVTPGMFQPRSPHLHSFWTGLHRFCALWASRGADSLRKDSVCGWSAGGPDGGTGAELPGKAAFFHGFGGFPQANAGLQGGSGGKVNKTLYVVVYG